MVNKKKVLAAAVAVTTAISALSGCGTGGEDGETTTVSWYLSGVKQDSSYDEVFKKVNEELEKKYNLKLNIVLTDGTNFSQKIQMMNAAQEEYDLAFTSNWTNNYYTNVQNGSLLELTDLLPKHAPKLWDSLYEYERNAVKVDGEIYAVPNWQVQARSTGFVVPKEKIEKTGMSVDDLNTMEDFGEYLRKLKTIEPETVRAGGGWQILMTYYGLTTIVQEGLPGSIYFNQEGKPTVVNQFDTDEFMEYAHLMRKWEQEGLINSNLSSGKDYQKLNQHPGGWENYKPGIEISKKTRYGYDWVGKQVSPAVMATESVLSTMTGVGRYSKHPEESVKIMEIMYTDKELYNTLAWGIEGQNYEKVSDNVIRTLEDSKYSMSDWMLGSVKNSYITEGNPETIWKDTEEYNNNSIKSQLMGFVLDNSAITADLGNCETVVKKYLESIESGSVDPDAVVPEFRQALKTAGVDRLIAEVQRQVDKWWSENK